MLSPADMIIIGAVALLFFGPDQLPKVARNAGRVIRDVQATSASFIREMERAADEPDKETPRSPWTSPPAAERHADPTPAAAPFPAEAELVTPHDALGAYVKDEPSLSEFTQREFPEVERSSGSSRPPPPVGESPTGASPV